MYVCSAGCALFRSTGTDVGPMSTCVSLCVLLKVGPMSTCVSPCVLCEVGRIYLCVLREVGPISTCVSLCVWREVGPIYLCVLREVRLISTCVSLCVLCEVYYLCVSLCVLRVKIHLLGCLCAGSNIVGLSAWTSCQPSHTAPPACLPSQNEDSPTRLRTCLNQPDVWYGLFCGWVRSPFPLFFSRGTKVWLQAFSKLPPRCPPKAYIAI